MEHRGVQYWIRQGIEARVWKWSFAVDAARTVEGESVSRKYAMATVTRAIDQQLEMRNSR
jgi:macrodomain Ter protein organizer (MatP/YcbG family)